jgi:hypothetical protein
MDPLDMEPIGAVFGLRNWLLEINIQWLEHLDLERNSNLWGKVIHTMWTGRRPGDAEKRGWTLDTRNRIVRS